jgi:hypothetical protein
MMTERMVQILARTASCDATTASGRSAAKKPLTRGRRVLHFLAGGKQRGKSFVQILHECPGDPERPSVKTFSLGVDGNKSCAHG